MENDKALSVESNSISKDITECENCHAEITGNFCSHCGQEAESTLKYFWSVILHLLDDIFSFDSRANRTLFPLLFRPGFLTNQYFAGHRVHYVPPLRLYLFISIIFFLSLKLVTGANPKNIVNINNHQETKEQLKTEIAEFTQQELTNDQQIKLKELQELYADITGDEKFVLRDAANELAKLKLAEIKTGSELPDEDLEKKKKLEKSISLMKSGKEGKEALLEKPDFVLGNQADGSLAFPFLDDETNKSLDKHARDFETKVIDTLENEPSELVTMALDKAPQLMFVLLPLFALLLKVLYLFSKRLYLEHLTVALHSHSFIFLSVLIIELITLTIDKFVENSTVASLLEFILVLLVIWMPIYLYLMQKKVYKQGHFFTFLKFVITGVLYSFLITLTGLIAFIWGVASS